ncbi:hypothetical protein Pint_02898 [Pistacia integerrima]|uniref:Uncharacterized protein n=1 Tax=Pistacia integerrima TaxID=434235 RepID=A0ACC0ZDT6_9ROSI|nr:hypothetical protein Pint_02898 [Pistacia integerrima]
MVSEEPNQSTQDPKQTNPVPENGQHAQSLFSPRFKSVAAMAGWDEEAILVAALLLWKTRLFGSLSTRNEQTRYSSLQTPVARSKRRAHRRSPVSIPIPVLDLDEEETAKEEKGKKNVELKEKKTKEEKKIKENELSEQSSGVSCSNTVLQRMDKLRDELSCAICLEICFEPSTTTCGHSFCKKCLRSAADKCGRKCPKCRQLISHGRSCTVNTVLWNTIQLLFPQEVEARKAAGALSSRELDHENLQRGIQNNVRTRSMRPSAVSNTDSTTRRREIPSLDEDEDEDAELTQRLQRENSPLRFYNNVRTRASSMRRRRIASQDEEAALVLRMERENLARLVSRDASVRRTGTRSQDEDAALALRLQREEFMEAFRGNDEQQSRRSVSLATANLRAMASRAINNRMRGRPL